MYKKVNILIHITGVCTIPYTILIEVKRMDCPAKQSFKVITKARLVSKSEVRKEHKKPAG